MLQTMDIHVRTIGLGVDIGEKCIRPNLHRSISDLDLIRSSSYLVQEAKSGIFLWSNHLHTRLTRRTKLNKCHVTFVNFSSMCSCK